MAKIDWKQARQAAVAAEQKKEANEAAARMGTTLEAIQQARPSAQMKPEKSQGGRPTTAKEETKSVTIRITEAQSEKINEWVYLKRGTDRSDVVRQALDLLFSE